MRFGGSQEAARALACGCAAFRERAAVCRGFTHICHLSGQCDSVFCTHLPVLQVQERRAVRGLAAASRLQGQYRAAIRHLERVLAISREIGEFTGDSDAYGTIADCFTDLYAPSLAASYSTNS